MYSTINVESALKKRILEAKLKTLFFNRHIQQGVGVDVLTKNFLFFSLTKSKRNEIEIHENVHSLQKKALETKAFSKAIF